jgi:ketosteroid isomerase-like protein
MTAPAVAHAFARAVIDRDFAGARDLLHPEVDFRAMTPNRIWEAGDPAGIEDILRGWLADPDEEIARIEPAGPAALVVDTARVGWIVHGSDSGGPFSFEQQAYVREADGQVAWLRIMCSGSRTPG